MEKSKKGSILKRIGGLPLAVIVLVLCMTCGVTAAQFLLIPGWNRDMKEGSTPIEEIAEKWEASLTEDQLSSVKNTLDIKQLIKETDDYIANSKYMQLDGYNVNTLIDQFNVYSAPKAEGEASQAPAIVKKYITYITGSEVMEDLAELLNWDVSRGYYSELITAADLGEGNFSVTIYYPEAEKLEEISVALQEALNRKVADYRSVAEYTLSLTSEVIASKTVQAVVDRQNSVQSKQVGYVNQINNALKVYKDNSSQNNLYYYKAGLLDEADYSANYIDYPAALKSKKLLYAIGLAGGFAVGIAIILLEILFDIRLVRGSELLEKYGFPYIGSLGKKTEKVTGKKAVDACKKAGIGKTCIIGTSFDKNSSGLLENIVSLLNESGVETEVAGDLLTDVEAFEKSGEVKNVILAEKVGIAKHTKIEQEIASLKACGIGVIAAISID